MASNVQTESRFPKLKEKTKPMFPLIQETINIFIRKKRKVYEKGCHQVAYCYQAK